MNDEIKMYEKLILELTNLDIQTNGKLNDIQRVKLELYKKIYLGLKKITDLQEENKRLKDLYERTCKHLFNIGNDELARHFQAQICNCNVFTPQVLNGGDE